MIVRCELSALASPAWRRRSGDERCAPFPDRSASSRRRRCRAAAHDTWSGSGSSSDTRRHRPSWRSWNPCQRQLGSAGSVWKGMRFKIFGQIRKCRQLLTIPGDCGPTACATGAAGRDWIGCTESATRPSRCRCPSPVHFQCNCYCFCSRCCRGTRSASCIPGMTFYQLPSAPRACLREGRRDGVFSCFCRRSALTALKLKNSLSKLCKSGYLWLTFWLDKSLQVAVSVGDETLRWPLSFLHTAWPVCLIAQLRKVLAHHLEIVA